MPTHPCPTSHPCRTTRPARPQNLPVPHQTLLFSGSFDHQIRIWDMGDWTCVRVLAGHSGYIHALIVPDTNHVYSASGDKTIKFWSCSL